MQSESPEGLLMLSAPDRLNFDNLARAFISGDAALVEVRRVADGAVVAAVCAIGRAGGDFLITPFAVMVEGNPFELYDPPSPEGGFFTQDEGHNDL